MKRKQVKARFKGLSEQIDTLTDTEYFQTHGETLYDVGRNTVKRFRWEGVDMVVKRFGGISAFNRLMYGTFRESKAMRAYKYASKLRAMHIATPEEVAVVETFNYGRMADSYFISMYASCRPLSFLQEFTFEKTEWFPLLDALAIWLREVHDKGILHQDLNLGNILYQEHPDGKFSFQLIDNNRMKFGRHWSLDARLKDLCRLTANLDLFHYVLKQYLSYYRCDYRPAQRKGYFYKLMFEYRQEVKKKLRRWGKG